MLKPVSRRNGLTALFFVFVICALLLWPGGVDAQDNDGVPFIDVANVISNILLHIVSFLGKLLIQISNILIAVAQYNNFTDAAAIAKGWVLIRDLGNIFFIVILLVIAFATILKIENYRYNRLLGRLIIMAVLVNFSKMIAGLFIDFTQIIMLTFVAAFKNAAAGNIADALGLTEMLRLRDTGTAGITSGEIMTALILATVLLLISLVVILVMTVVFIMRVIALWILVVLSPFAYILRTFPSTERYASRWWTEFGKYAAAGPVLAFFLWLTFTVIATGPVNTPADSANLYGFINPSIKEQERSVRELEAGGIAGSLSSTISEISKSERLMSFIIAISMMVGSLMVTSQLGVAGGKLASGAVERVRKFGGRAATLAAVGAVGGFGLGALYAGRRLGWKATKSAAKGLGRWGLESAGAKLGIDLTPEGIKEGWEEAKEKHRSERKAATRAKAQIRGEKYPALASLSSLGHFFGTFKRPSALKTLFKPGGFSELMGTEYMSRQKGADEKQNAYQELAEKFKMVAKPDGTWESPANLMRDMMVNRELDESRPMVRSLVTLNLESNPDADELQYKWSTTDAAGKLHNHSAPFEEYWRKEKDPVLRQAGATDVEIRAAHDEYLAKHIDQLTEEGLNEKRGEIRGDVIRDTQGKDDDLTAQYQVELQKEIDKKNTEIGIIDKTGSTVDQLKKTKEKNQELKKVEDLLKQIDKDIAKKEAAGMDTTIEEKRKADNYHQREILKKMIKPTDRDKAAAQTTKGHLKEDIEKMIFLKNFSGMGLSEKDKKKDELEGLKKAWVEAQKSANEVRPEVDYELRRKQRLEINKIKSELTTDNWQEIVSFIEDAQKRGDLNRVAAGMQKAAEYGNANEIQNWFGYDSDAGGLKEMIMGELVGTKGGLTKEKAEGMGLHWEDYEVKRGGKIFQREGFKNKKGMGMSEEQALAIGNDISYIGEKFGHWGIARAVTVKNGRQLWQPEDDRMIEVLAEVRKQDFENAMRRFNRLAFGNESPVDKWDFRSTGNREFDLNTFALAFMKENYKKLPNMYGRGRFGVNLAINLTMPHNLEKLRGLSRFLPTSEKNAFNSIMTDVSNYGSSGKPQFEEVQHMNKLAARGEM
ncbi:MAG: hypothetical protein V1838_00235 [Patescibacteria group bacterium]